MCSLLLATVSLLVASLAVPTVDAGAGVAPFSPEDLTPLASQHGQQQHRRVLTNQVATAYCGFQRDGHPWLVNTEGAFQVCDNAASNAEDCGKAFSIDFNASCLWTNDSCVSLTAYGGSHCYHQAAQNKQSCEAIPTFQGVDSCSWKEPTVDTKIEFPPYCGNPSTVDPWSLPLNICASHGDVDIQKEQCETTSSFEYLNCSWENGACHGNTDTCNRVSDKEMCQNTIYVQFGVCKWFVPLTTAPTAAPSVSTSPTFSIVPTVSMAPSMSASPTKSIMPSASISPSLSQTPSASVAPSASLMPSLSLMPSTSTSTHPSVSPSPSMAPSISASSNPSSLPTKNPTRSYVAQIITPAPKPSSQPTTQPTGVPTALQSSVPTTLPSMDPSGLPTRMPSTEPTIFPSVSPTLNPSTSPSANPSGAPSTRFPSSTPTLDPTSVPSGLPTSVPSVWPSDLPTSSPSDNPTYYPTISYTLLPTREPIDDDDYAGPNAVGGVLAAGSILTALAACGACIWKCCCCCCKKKKEQVFAGEDANAAMGALDNTLKVPVDEEMGQI